MELVKECLKNVPGRRPSTDDLLARLQRMREEVEGEYGGIQVKLDLSKMRMARELRQKDRRLEELTQLQVYRVITIGGGTRGAKREDSQISKFKPPPDFK